MKLLVIYYHEVVEKGQGYSYQKIEIDKFRKQMKYLSENGYQSLFFSELDKPFPEKAIIVSFDDGFKTVYENAAPIMKEYGIKGNIYLPTAYIGTDEHFMTVEIVKELYETGQFEMQAHTHTHVDIRRLNQQEMDEEIAQSTKWFSSNLGYEPAAFCMPFGTWNKRSVGMIRGRYRYLLGSHYGRADKRKLTDYVLPRIGISNDDSIEKFEAKLAGKYDWKGPLQKARLMINNIQGKHITEYEY